MKRPTRHESPEHENVAGAILRAIEGPIAAKFGRRMGVGLFICDFGENGFLGWAANMQREDAATMLLEWVGTNKPEVLKAALERWRAQAMLGPERTH